MVRFLLLLALVPGVALAVTQGGTLYVRNKDTKVLEKADVKSRSIGLLQYGAAVKWLGADPAQRMLHKVEYDDTATKAKVTGYVLQANLTPNAPAKEYLSKDDGKPIDPQAFRSSGAATKALGGTALEWAAQKKLTGLPERLIALENISLSVSPSAVQQRSKALGLAYNEAAEPPPPPDAAPATKKKGGKKGKKP